MPKKKVLVQDIIKQGVVAGVRIRLGALFLDTIIVGFIQMIAAYIFLYYNQLSHTLVTDFFEDTSWLLQNLPLRTQLDVYIEKLLVPWYLKYIDILIVLAIVHAVYYVLFTSFWHATPGKRLLGIFVITERGKYLSIIRSLLRYLAYFVSPITVIAVIYLIGAVDYVLIFLRSYSWGGLLSLLAFMNYGFFIMIVAPYKQALHDMFIGTGVIRHKPPMADHY